MMFKRACVLAGLAVSATAFGQLTPVGPFTGDSSENMNAIFPQHTFQAQYTGLFGSTAVLNAYPPGATSMHFTTGWSFFSVIFAHSPTHFAGGAGCNAEYVFDTAVGSFGGYFGTNADSPGATANFYDENNNLIGSQPIQSPQGAWAWDGWDSTIPIKRVTIIASNQFGGFIMMDDLEIRAGGSGCEADFNGDQQVDFFDYLDFVAAFDAEDPSADFNGDNQVDFFDYLDFAAAFDNCQ